jgi:cytochrome c556
MPALFRLKVHIGSMLIILLLLGLPLIPGSASQQQLAAPRPAKLEAVAETRLLMEGLALANHRGLVKLLKQRPGDVEAWGFARGQALLIAETANLLLLRPPKNAQGEKVWMQRSMDLRDDATALARQLSNRDYERSVKALTTLTATCNRCHQTFRVPTRIGIQAEGEGRMDTSGNLDER